jgi:hypothetical protein
MNNKITPQMRGYEDYCLETFLQWLQIRKQQSLNMKFAIPADFNEGELAAYNTVIHQLENFIQNRNEYWNRYFRTHDESHSVSNG